MPPASLGVLPESVTLAVSTGGASRVKGTWAATRAKHLLVKRASRSAIPGRPTDLQSSLVEGDKVFGVYCAACHGMDGHRPTDAGR